MNTAPSTAPTGGYSTRRTASCALIGAAWRQLEQTQPQVELLLDDRHPNDAGTYLAACVLYDVIYHKKTG